MIKKFRTYFILSGLIAVIALSGARREAPLMRLQRKILNADSKADSSKVLDKLYKHYLALPLPDSIPRIVNDTLAVWFRKPILHTSLDVNIYQWEFNALPLYSRHLCLTRAQKNNAEFDALIESALSCAHRLYAATGNNYWIAWFSRVRQFTLQQARAWLRAAAAERLAYELSSSSRYNDALLFAAYSLQQLKEAADPRLRLDNMQRIMYILYQYQSFFDLAFLIAKEGQKQALENHYTIRAIGLLYNEANAYALSSFTENAEARFARIIHHSKLDTLTPHLDEYAISAMLGRIDIMWKNGNYNDALTACDSLLQEHVRPSDSLALAIYRGIIYSRLGYFEKSETAYETAIRQAIKINSHYDEAIALHNLADLYKDYYEYEYAVSLYDSALALLTKHCPLNYDRRCLFTLNMADVSIAHGRRLDAEQYLRKAQALANSINAPLLKGMSYCALARLLKNDRQPARALHYFEKAEHIFHTFALTQLEEEVQLESIDCYIARQDYAAAAAVLEYLKSAFAQKNDKVRTIDAIGIAAKIAYRQGAAEQAAQMSHALIDTIQNHWQDFQKSENLVLLNHRLYDYLKNAVVYEIAQKDTVAAFGLCDAAKAWSTKMALSTQNTMALASASNPLDLAAVQQRLDDDQIILNYVYAMDTLYTFVTSSTETYIRTHAIDEKSLQQAADSYYKSMIDVIDYFSGKTAKNETDYYEHYVKHSQLMSRILIDDERLARDIRESSTIYIVNDNNLCRFPFCTLLHPETSAFVFGHADIITLPSAAFLANETASAPFDLIHSTIVYSIDHRFQEADRLRKFIDSTLPHATELTIDTPTPDKRDVVHALNHNYNVHIFFGHSQSSRFDPGLSYITISVFNKADATYHTCDLYLNDLATLNWLETKMVLMIGCGTMGNKVYGGSGLVGFQHGLLTLGVPRVLGTYWEINSAFAAAQLELIISQMCQKNDLSKALTQMQQAQRLELMNHNYFNHPHPYLWGGYSVSQLCKR